jgi:propionyl-CoA carboxylase beta chain
MPIVTLVDVPGYLPGRKQEEAGILPHGATLLTAYGEAKVPMVCLVLRKSFGGASVLSFAADVRLGLPTARIGPMGVDAALEVALGPELDGATDDDKAARAARRAAWLEEHDHAWASAQTGYLDQIVRPADARRALHAAVERLSEGGDAIVQRP